MDTGAGSFLGEAGGVGNVSGRLVSRREEGSWCNGAGGTTEGFGCSWLERENERIPDGIIRWRGCRNEGGNWR